MEQKADSFCKVCGDKASGKHYGVASCDGCRGFFKRSIRRGLAYHCKESGSCIVDVTRRNQCQACRFKKCLAVNMKRDAVQHERAPRTTLSTHCPSGMAATRRHPYGYPTHAAAFLGTSGPAVDFPSYHFVYPQPSFPFSFGIKHHGLGLPNNFGLGIFNCSNSLSATTSVSPVRSGRSRRVYDSDVAEMSAENRKFQREPFPQPHCFYRSANRDSNHEDRARTTTSVSSGEDDSEVTSSVETRDMQSCHHDSYDSFRSKPHPADLTIPQGPESVYESAAKLLFLTVKWARSIPSFVELAFRDQSALLEDSWSELFVLSAAQWTLPVDEEYLTGGASLSGDKQGILEREAKKLKKVMAKFATLKVDHTEYACLKALALFKSETADLKDRVRVEMLQDQTHVMLHDYCISQNSSEKARFGKLLMLLPSVSMLSKDLIEELLFRKTIGNISIERVISDMLKNNNENS